MRWEKDEREAIIGRKEEKETKGAHFFQFGKRKLWLI